LERHTALRNVVCLARGYERDILVFAQAPLKAGRSSPQAREHAALHAPEECGKIPPGNWTDRFSPEVQDRVRRARANMRQDKEAIVLYAGRLMDQGYH
jgi:hypothetical protein